MHSFTDLAKKFEQHFLTSLPFPPSPVTLYEPCTYLLQLGGKRVRPALCLMANELFGSIVPDAWHAAGAIEMFHNFTLVHDDIMDKAPLRRGQPTIHTKYGLTAGILGGDVMGIYAYAELAKIRLRLPQVLQLFNKTAIEVCEGQQLDMDYEVRNDVSNADYIHMITLKTSVLLACGLKMGALVGGSTEGNADKLYEFGKNLGLAFQLRDDYLDAYAATEKLGKQKGGDIKANKKTFLLLKALENADMRQRSQIQALIKTDTEDKVDSMLSLYAQTGAEKACLDIIEEYSQKAYNCLDEVAIPSARKKPLFEIAAYLLERDK